MLDSYIVWESLLPHEKTIIFVFEILSLIKSNNTIFNSEGIFAIWA